MSLNLRVKTATVPAGFCFSGFNSSSWPELVSLLYAQFPDDISLFNFGSELPGPDKRDLPWIRTDADGFFLGVYTYASGNWLTRHGTPPGLVCMYEGTEASIDTFDGGEAGDVTSISGPFWEKVSELDAKFPIGPGTLPSTTTIAVGDTGGEEKHALTSAENAAHTHVVPGSTTPQGNGDFDVTGGTAGTPAVYPGTSDSGSSGNGDPHNNIPPYYGIFFIRRTAREFDRV